jgi:hypothetical protein
LNKIDKLAVRITKNKMFVMNPEDDFGNKFTFTFK